MGIVRKVANIKKPSAVRTCLLRVLAILLCVVGIYAFVKNDMASYLFLRTRFVFFDIEQPLALFFAEYLGMMGLWAVCGYYIGKFLQWFDRRKYT